MTYPPTPMPVPGVTLPNWGQQLLDSLRDAYDKGTMARVVNATNTATFFAGPAGVGAGAVTPIAGMVLAIPATDHDVDIRWQANIGLGAGTTANAYGPLYTLLYEITTGVAVALDSDLVHKDLGMNYITTALVTATWGRLTTPACSPSTPRWSKRAAPR
jgi:hypothetical protein